MYYHAYYREPDGTYTGRTFSNALEALAWAHGRRHAVAWSGPWSFEWLL